MSLFKRRHCSFPIWLALIGLWSSAIAAAASGEQNKLNVPRVLLPRATDGIVANFTLRVTEDGERDSSRCYTWRSTRSDVVTVTPVALDTEGNVLDGTAALDCSSAAVVSAVGSSSSRLTSIVWAEHPSQGLRCDVMVDSIHALEIFTTTRKLFLEDAPEAFEISAKDVKGDRFSSLEGLEFDWRIEHDVRNDSMFVDGASIIKFIKFSDSEYRPPPSVSALEARNKRGYMVLLESLQTGSAIVSAALHSPAWRDVGKASVRLLVVANVVLQPDYDVYLIQHGSVHYRVMQIKQAATSFVPMPSPQYQLQITDDQVCSLDEKRSVVTCTELGNSEVRLKDRNVIEGDTAHPSAMIHVVMPAYLNLLVKPGRNWILQNQRDYMLIAELYDRESHLIYSSDNLRIELKVDAAYFQVVKESQNGTVTNVKTIKTGKTQVTAQLVGIVTEDRTLFKFPTPITKTQIVEINEPLAVHPRLLVFPSDRGSREGKTPYTYQLQATGGSGAYTWSTADGSVCQVEGSSGRLTASSKEGHTLITASDVKNSDHTDRASVYVVPVSDITIPPAVREAQVGLTLAVPVALRGTVPGKSSPVMFTDCRHVALTVSVGDPDVFVVDSQKPDKSAVMSDACTSVYLKALKAGFSTVKITYNAGDTEISADVIMGAFDSMEAVDGNKDVVLAVGSSHVVRLRGGPLPWIEDQQQYRVILGGDKMETVHGHSLRGTDNVNFIELTCTKLGEKTVAMKVGNLPSQSLPMPVESELMARVSCVDPAQLVLRVRPQQYGGSENLPACPWHKTSGEAYPILRGRDALVDIDVFDSLGRKLNNYSSLHFTWDVSDKNLLDVIEPDGILLPWHGKRKHMDSSTGHKVVRASDGTGKVKLTAHVKRYHKDALHAVKSQHHAALEHPLEASVHLALVDEASFEKEQLTVFNHPNHEETAGIRGGSGYFHLAASNSDLAKISYDMKSRRVSIWPVMDGDFSLTAYDLCVSGKPAVLFVTVAGLSRIEVVSADKMELGSSVPLLVRAYDSADRLIPVTFYHLIDLRPFNLADVVTLREETTGDARPSERLYSLHGSSVGRTGIFFKGTKGNASEIRSNTVEIQVFAPLHIEPRNVTLTPTAKLQLSVEGGPQPLRSIRFSVRARKTVSVDGNGLVEALQAGNTVISGEIVDVDPVTGKEVVYAYDEVTVYVVPFKGVRIYAPLRSLAVGQAMPLIAMGLTEQETPFSFGSAVPAFKFAWAIDNLESAGLQSVYDALGLRSGNSIAVRVLGRSSGVVSVTLKASDPSGHVFTDSIVVAIVEEAQLLVPSCSCDTLLMTPKARIKLRTNKDGSAQMQCNVIDGADFVSCERDGQLISGHKAGQGIVVVDVMENEQRTSLVRHVKITEASYLKISAQGELRSSPDLSYVPLGIALRFPVTHHDSLGREFHAVSSRLQYRTSRNDVVSLTWSGDSSNSTLVARAIKSGSAILKVWDADRSNLFDYIEIRVDAVISPHAQEVQVGESVCFRCGLSAPDGRHGAWTSSAPGVLRIDQSSGVAVAVSQGQATVFYNVSRSTAARTVFTVKPIQTLEMAASTGGKLSISNNFRLDDKGYPVDFTLPVVFGKSPSQTECDESQLRQLANIKRSAFSSIEDLFRCEMRFSRIHTSGVTADDVFTIRPEVDDKGDFVCSIEPKRGNQPSEEALSGFEADLIVTAKDGQGHVATISVEFVPRFLVVTPQVHVNQVQTESGLVIVAVPSVQNSLQVRSSDIGVVQVGNPVSAPWPASTASSKLPSQKASLAYHYPITLVPGPWLAQRLSSSAPHITVESFRLGQRVEIPVKIRLTPELVKATPVGAVDAWSLLIPSLSIGGLLAVLYLIWRMYQQSVEDKQYYQYLAATGHAPPTPVSRTPPGVAKVSPMRTPERPERRWSGQKEDGEGVRLWSVEQPLADSPTRRNALFRHSPNTGL